MFELFRQQLTIGSLFILRADQRILLHLLTHARLLGLPAGTGNPPEDAREQQAAGNHADKNI